jgi:hypothetical protein
MASETDTTKWSGEGQFTQLLLEHLRNVSGIRLIRVEDAPSTRSEADYQFMSNELFVDFAVRSREERFVRFGFLPARRVVADKVMTLATLEELLTSIPEVGAPDYADDGMLQYLRTERIVPPYQTRGYKLVELVRVYESALPAGPKERGCQADK